MDISNIKNKQLWQLVDFYYCIDERDKNIILNEQYQKLRQAFNYLLDNSKQFMYLHYWGFSVHYKQLVYDKQFRKRHFDKLLYDDINNEHGGTIRYIQNLPNGFNDKQFIRYMFDKFMQSKSGCRLFYSCVIQGVHKSFLEVVSYQQFEKYIIYWGINKQKYCERKDQIMNIWYD